MAEAATPEAVTPASDPYDLGETGLNLQATAPEPEAVAAVASDSTPAPAAQSRNADGTFAPKAEAPAAKPTHPDYLVSRALDLGLDAGEIAEYSTPQLDRMLWRMTQDRHAARDNAATSRTLQELPTPTAAGPTEAQGTPAPEAPAADSFDLGFSPEGYEPEMIAALKKHFGGLTQKIAALTARLEVTERRDHSRSQQSAAEMIDSAFSQLPQLEKLIGKGSIDDFPKEAPERMRRLMLLQAAGIKSADQVKKGTILTALRKASELLYPDAVAATPSPAAPVVTPPNGQRITQEQWDRAGVARPTHRSGSPKPAGVERAVENLTNKLNDSGKLPGNDSREESEILEGLPG